MYKYDDSLPLEIIDGQSYLRNVTIYSRFEIEDETFNCLNELLGKGQIVELDKQKVVLSLVKLVDEYDFNLTIRAPLYDGGSKEYCALFRVFLLDSGQYLFMIRFERHYHFKIITSEQEIKRRYEAFAHAVKGWLNHHFIHNHCMTYEPRFEGSLGLKEFIDKM